MKTAKPTKTALTALTILTLCATSNANLSTKTLKPPRIGTDNETTLCDVNDVYYLSKPDNPWQSNYTVALQAPYTSPKIFYQGELAKIAEQKNNLIPAQYQISVNNSFVNSLSVTINNVVVMHSYSFASGAQTSLNLDENLIPEKVKLLDGIMKNDNSSGPKKDWDRLITCALVQDSSKNLILAGFQTGDNHLFYADWAAVQGKNGQFRYLNYDAITLPVDSGVISAGKLILVLRDETDSSGANQNLSFEAVVQIDSIDALQVPLSVQKAEISQGAKLTKILKNHLNSSFISLKHFHGNNDWELVLVNQNLTQITNIYGNFSLKTAQTPNLVLEASSQYTYNISHKFEYIGCDSTHDHIICSGKLKKAPKNSQNPQIPQPEATLSAVPEEDNNGVLDIYDKTDGDLHGIGKVSKTIQLPDASSPPLDFRFGFAVQNYQDNIISFIQPGKRSVQTISIAGEIDSMNRGYWKVFWVMSVCICLFLGLGIVLAYNAGKRVDWGQGDGDNQDHSGDVDLEGGEGEQRLYDAQNQKLKDSGMTGDKLELDEGGF